MDHEKVKERVRCQLQPVKPERKTAVGEKIKSSRGTRWYLKLVVRGCHLAEASRHNQDRTTRAIQTRWCDSGTLTGTEFECGPIA